MPALKIWEPTLIAGDDLRLATTILILFRIFQSSLLITILYNLYSSVDHDPDLFLVAGCVQYSENYWRWFASVKIACFVVLAYTLGGIGIEMTVWKISGVGTPVESERRRKLVPLCKCLVVPMFVLRAAGFVFAAFSVAFTGDYCNCLKDANVESLEGTFHCQFDRGWFHLAKMLVICMGVDVILHGIVGCYITKKRLFRWYDERRSPKARSAVEKSWEDTCRRCCQCSSIMTCYMFGGRNLKSGGYADVAIALTDFLDDGGSLDIVPSDIAAALICLVNIQKQKQIECKRELLKDSRGLFEDKQFATKFLRMFRDSNSSKKRLTLESKSLLESMTGAYGDSPNIGDIDQGFEDLMKSFAIVEDDEFDIESAATEEVEELQKFMSQNNTLEDISFRLVHDNHRIDFKPRIANILDHDNEFDRLVLGEGARYARVALAAYSWMLYVWTNRCSGCCSLTGATFYNAATCKLRCCHKNENIIGDNFLGWKHSAIMKTLGIDSSDIVYANFKNRIGVNPYMIVVDRAWRTVVIAIRGTLSLEDMITDVTISPQCLEALGQKFGFDGAGEYCHNGILAGARWIYDDLESHNILDDVLSKECSGYHLRVIGHSLGAGIAAMLSLMLRKKYPSLMCLAFSPPGCVFSQRTAEESRKYVCSYVLNNDVVPRLSYESLVNLRNDVIQMVARIKVPKNKVFLAHFKPGGSEKEVFDVVNEQLYSEDSIPESAFWNEFGSYKAKQQHTMSGRRSSDNSAVAYDNMTLPGQIVQVVRTSDDLSNDPCFCCVSCIKCTACCGMPIDTRAYKVRWSDQEDFSEIFVSPSMLVDHFPHNVARALECAAKSYDIPLKEGREAIVGHLEVKYN